MYIGNDYINNDTLYNDICCEDYNMDEYISNREYRVTHYYDDLFNLSESEFKNTLSKLNQNIFEECTSRLLDSNIPTQQKITYLQKYTEKSNWINAMLTSMVLHDVYSQSDDDRLLNNLKAAESGISIDKQPIFADSKNITMRNTDWDIVDHLMEDFEMIDFPSSPIRFI